MPLKKRKLSFGTVKDANKIIGSAHQMGAMTYVGAVPYAPNSPIDLQELDCEFLTKLSLGGRAFIKMHGPRNYFIIVDARREPYNPRVKGDNF